MVHAATVAPTLIEHEETAFGMGPPGWVALSMIVVILIMVWKKVPGAIARGLDTKIATIRKQLDEAAALRAEAEQIRNQAQAQAHAAHQDAQAIVVHARSEASNIIAQARIDADSLIERRARMAEDKIAAAERAAVIEVRNRAADAAVNAAARIIAERNGPANDRDLVEKTILGLG